MGGQARGTDLFSAASAAGAEVMRALAGEASLAALFWGAAPEVEVIHQQGISHEVGLSLSSAGGRHLAEAVRRSAVPLRVDVSTLPPEAERLRTALAVSGISSIVLFPLFGERSPAGYIIVPVQPDVVVGDVSRWTIECRALAALQVAAGAALARVLVGEDDARSAPLFDGVVVADPWERVLLADGIVLESPGWVEYDPFGRPLDRLPGGARLWAVTSSSSDAFRWEPLEFPLSEGSASPVDVAAVETDLVVGRAGKVRIHLIRDRRVREGAAGRSVERILALAVRVAHASDELLSPLKSPAKTLGERGSMAGLLRTATTVPELVRTLMTGVAPPGSLGTVDLNATLTSLVERVRPELETERIRVFSFLDPELGSVAGDTLDVVRGLRTVVARARRSLQASGGTLTVRTWRENGWACAAVSDDGAGTVAVSPFVSTFEPLFGERPDVIDEALRGVRLAVERLGGRFQLESRPGLWNRCTLMLPFREPVRQQIPAPTEEVHVRRDADGHLEVLVVDDNQALRSVLKRYLERRGHVVTEAVDGDDALSIVGAREFDRVIVDIQMPGKSGPEFFGCLEEVAPSLRSKTFFMTGGVLQDSIEQFLDESGRPSIPKPFNLTELARTLEAGV